jgi:hypothetical protein
MPHEMEAGMATAEQLKALIRSHIRLDLHQAE